VERNHARRRDRSPLEIHADSPGDDESLSRVFDRAWAVALMKQAAERQKEWAAQRDSAAQKRVELLHLRFHEGLPIREIAKRWQVDASFLHHEYARARQEFKTALLEVLHHFHPDNPIAADRECQALLEALE
jgi:RNA polymerase sigma-70 factor (ECF subfamily)